MIFHEELDIRSLFVPDDADDAVDEDEAVELVDAIDALSPLLLLAAQASWGCFGPQMRTVPSSEADANRDGYTGFQLTQFTVRV